MTLQVISNKGKINQSQLKIIACVCMLLSHYLLCYGWKGWGIVKGNGLDFYEMIGQIVFPLFSFAIVCSMEKSTILHKSSFVFSIVSQIPFTMAFYPANLLKIEKGLFYLIYLLHVLIFGMVNMYLRYQCKYYNLESLHNPFDQIHDT